MDNKTIVKEIRRRQEKVKGLIALWVVASLGSFVCILAAFFAFAAKLSFIGILLGGIGIAGQIYRYKGKDVDKEAKKELKNYIGEHVVKYILAERIDITEYAPSNMLKRKRLNIKKGPALHAKADPFL